jgi:hypothetical protein
MKRLPKRLLTVSAILLFLAIAGGVYAYHKIGNVIRDSYCKWQAAELVIEYREHQGKMPDSWDALWDYFSDKDMQGFAFYPFHVVRERIIIDFSSLPALEMEYSSEEQIPEIIKARSGAEAYWEGREPNQFVNRQLIQRKPPGKMPPPTEP